MFAGPAALHDFNQSGQRGAWGQVASVIFLFSTSAFFPQDPHLFSGKMCSWSGPHPVCDSNESSGESSVQGSLGPLSPDDLLPGTVAQHLFHRLSFFRSHRIFRGATTNTLWRGGDPDIFWIDLLCFHNADRPEQASSGKRFSELSVVAISRICEHDAELNIFSDSVQFFECQGPLGLETAWAGGTPARCMRAGSSVHSEGRKSRRAKGIGSSSFASVSDTRH